MYSTKKIGRVGRKGTAIIFTTLAYQIEVFWGKTGYFFGCVHAGFVNDIQ